MENATKALLIAAAVLVAILIISLGLVVYNIAAESVGNVNMSDTEIVAFNDKFTRFEGTNQSGSQVNALMQTVLNNNLQEKSSTQRIIVLTVKDKSGDEKGKIDSTTTSSPAKVPAGARFTVTCTRDADSGLITKIDATSTNQDW